MHLGHAFLIGQRGWSTTKRPSLDLPFISLVYSVQIQIMKQREMGSGIIESRSLMRLFFAHDAYTHRDFIVIMVIVHYAVVRAKLLHRIEQDRQMVSGTGFIAST